MSDNIKVVFCIPSLGAGGAERVTSILANKFVEHGYDVSIIMLSHMLCLYPLADDVQTVCLNCDDDAGMSFAKRFLTRLKKIRRAVKEIAPDVVISFMSETNIDVCLALAGIKVPIIVSERNDPETDPASKAKKLLRRIAYRKPKGFVFQTPDAQAYFSKRIQQRSKIILNPLGKAMPPRFEGEREKRIVAVGRLNKQKNFSMLIDAFAEFSKTHPDRVLEIYGEGALEEQTREYISSKGLQDKVILKGFCKDVHEKILSAEMFVMSSDFEGMPNALLEAMALGLPCISTDCPCGGPRMLIEPYENGLLVPVKDGGKLLEAMCFMADNPEKAQAMSKQAVLVRERAELDRVAGQWIDLANSCKEGKYATFDKSTQVNN